MDRIERGLLVALGLERFISTIIEIGRDRRSYREEKDG